MTRPDVEPLRELLYRALVRYLTVRPTGFELQPGERLRPSIEARLLGFGGARTLYVDRKPTCRSLDGVHPITGNTARACSSCPQLSSCTPQIRVDLIVEQRPFRLLLAYSAAQTFLVYEATLRQRNLAIADVVSGLSHFSGMRQAFMKGSARQPA